MLTLIDLIVVAGTLGLSYSPQAGGLGHCLTHIHDPSIRYLCHNLRELEEAVIFLKEYDG